ncbi:MAG: hypothetical protein QM774_04400 [Gordonia sp. (in: high G+C Gram-positive bacteria)]|uniref:hypothetical protein n=1 Tax=Gordonia sp. (in: high G+C Gram-positive bacteria) TaxID=84139 RepID=UPI0039E3D552
MLTALLLAIAAVFGVVMAPIRTRMVGDAAVSDRRVRAVDVCDAVAAAALIGAAAIAAAVSGPVTGVQLAAAQVAAVLAAATAGGFFVRSVLAAGSIPTRNENYDDPEPDPPLRGGRVIGVLERVAIAVTLLAGWPAGIAVILGVKGLARFPQLREHHASEQFIIGTFASVLWACAAAGTVLLLAA